MSLRMSADPSNKFPLHRCHSSFPTPTTKNTTYTRGDVTNSTPLIYVGIMPYLTHCVFWILSKEGKVITIYWVDHLSGGSRSRWKNFCLGTRRDISWVRSGLGGSTISSMEIFRGHTINSAYKNLKSFRYSESTNNSNCTHSHGNSNTKTYW